MNNMITIPAFSLEQPIGTFYIGKIDYKLLINMCSKDMDEIIKNGPYDIYQRRLDTRRIPVLKSYMDYSRASFPNGVILNSKYPLKFTNNELFLRNEENTFFIIDGQHRIEALKYYKGEKPFEICVVIFENIDLDLQTDIFATVNNEQKKVNPTVRMNLRGNDRVDTPEKVSRKIAIAFNDSEESPFLGRIRFTDEPVKKDELKISLSSFIKPIVDNIYSDDRSFDIKDCLYLNHNDRESLIENGFSFNKSLWKFYVYSEEETIYIMLLNYFTAIKDIFPNDWNDNKALLAKTSGYSALMKLFIDVFKNSPLDMSYNSLYEKLKPLSEFEGHFSVDEIGVGNAASTRLYRLFSRCLGYTKSDNDNYYVFAYDE